MSIVQHVSITLASQSQIRQQMLRDVGLQFSCIPAHIDEDQVKAQQGELSLSKLALKLASAKAKHVSDKTNMLVIGADQICEIDGHILSKPGSKERAKVQLLQMQGKTHFQHSAVSLYHKQEMIWSWVETARLTMRPLDETTIDRYIALDMPLDSCGSYKLEMNGKHLFSKIEGDDATIQGLPIIPLLAFLHEKSYLAL